MNGAVIGSNASQDREFYFAEKRHFHNLYGHSAEMKFKNYLTAWFKKLRFCTIEFSRVQFLQSA
mgnify:FL=1